MGLFDTLFGGQKYPGLSSTQMNILQDWLRRGGLQQSGAAWKPGSGAAQEISALNQLFGSTKTAIDKGTPFFESLIPSSPGALSPAAAAEKSAATDALQSQLGSEGVAQMGQLNREYGGRLPASMVQSGFGNLARAGASGATDIARSAIGENVNLGEQGAQGLAGLAQLSGYPIGVLSGTLSSAPAGGYYDPGAIQKIGAAAKSLAGGIAGFSGLGGPAKPAPAKQPYLPLGAG